MTQTKNTYALPDGYLFIQSAVLVLKYGLDWNLPFWVTWFPTIAFVPLTLLALAFLALIALFANSK